MHGERFSGVLLEGNPSVVDQDVDTAILLLDEVSQLNDCVFIADVQDVEFRVETFLSESFQGFLCFNLKVYVAMSHSSLRSKSVVFNKVISLNNELSSVAATCH